MKDGSMLRYCRVHAGWRAPTDATRELMMLYFDVRSTARVCVYYNTVCTSVYPYCACHGGVIVCTFLMWRTLERHTCNYTAARACHTLGMDDPWTRDRPTALPRLGCAHTACVRRRTPVLTSPTLVWAGLQSLFGASHASRENPTESSQRGPLSRAPALLPKSLCTTHTFLQSLASCSLRTREWSPSQRCASTSCGHRSRAAWTAPRGARRRGLRRMTPPRRRRITWSVRWRSAWPLGSGSTRWLRPRSSKEARCFLGIE